MRLFTIINESGCIFTAINEIPLYCSLHIVPVRSIPKNYRSLTGKVIDAHNRGAVEFESALERDFYLILDFDPAVARFEEQPVTIAYHDPEDISRTYTPDVLVHYHPAPTAARLRPPRLYEIKYREDLRANWRDYRPKFKAAHRYAAQQDWVFRLISEREIRTPYLKNATFLRQFRTRTIASEDHRRVLTAFATAGQITPEALLTLLSSEPQERARLLVVLWHLVALAQIGTDLTLPLTMRSRLWPVEPARNDCGD